MSSRNMVKKSKFVLKRGKIKAVGEGKCKVYVYAQNGCAKTIKVKIRRLQR